MGGNGGSASNGIGGGADRLKKTGDVILLKLEDHAAALVSLTQTEERADAIVASDSEAQANVDDLGALAEENGAGGLPVLGGSLKRGQVAFREQREHGVRFGSEVVKRACLGVGHNDIVTGLLGKRVVQE